MHKSSFTRDVSSSDMAEFQKLLTADVELPSSNVALRLCRHSGCDMFQISDGDLQYYVAFVQPSFTDIVEEGEQIEIEGAAVHNGTDGWYLPADVVDQSSILPELRYSENAISPISEKDADKLYHFEDGSSEVATPTANPVERLDRSVTFQAVEFLGGKFPQKWLLESENGNVYYLRERSGSINLYHGTSRRDGERVFSAFIGSENPGTLLYENEVLNLVCSMDYLNLAEDYETNVSEKTKQKYYDDF